jgi:hypothetical protein
MVYCRLMDDLSGRHVHVAGIRRKRDFWLYGDGRGGVDGIRERGDGCVWWFVSVKGEPTTERKEGMGSDDGMEVISGSTVIC